MYFQLAGLITLIYWQRFDNNVDLSQDHAGHVAKWPSAPPMHLNLSFLHTHR